MKKSNYENKLLTTETEKKVVKKKSTYILISPQGNQYSVKAERLENFKEQMGVCDCHWIIK